MHHDPNFFHSSHNMNSKSIVFHLEEAQEELNRMIKNFQTDSLHDEGSFTIEMQHLYHHLNTAWNSRNSSENEIETEEIFKQRRQFPTDMSM